MSVKLPSILARDNLDDRREIWKLLAHPCMTDRHRFAFIAWCRQQVSDRFVQVTPMAGGIYTAMVAWQDFWALALQYGLNVDGALAELVRRVRQF